MARIITKEVFSDMIKLFVDTHDDMLYLDAVIIKLNELKIPIEEFDYRGMLSNDIIQKLKTEGKSLHLLSDKKK